MLHSPSTFRLTTRSEQDRVVVSAHGELDIATVPRLEQTIADVRSRGCTAVVLDLRELAFMDSTGIRLLLQVDAEARTNGFSFAIIDSNGPVRRVLMLTGVAKRLRYAEP